MAEQLHKRFENNQLKSLLESYIRKEIEIGYILSILKIGRSRFFEILKEYKQNRYEFSIEYQRDKPNNKITSEVEESILAELEAEKSLIKDPEVSVKDYNYSYIRYRLLTEYKHKVSVTTIIDRAKKHGYYNKTKIKKVHDREVLTNHAGELLQHDSSHHKWSPYAASKWYLITTLDDYSRKILFGDFFYSETSWAHIEVAQYICLKYGIPLSFYVDCHSIFRFVQGRDSFHRNHIKATDDANPQFKQVLSDLGIKLIYALSPQAKGKIERPYRWLQDRIVRTCAREGISQIEDAKEVLSSEIKRYNSAQVHSTTGEIPDIRFFRALDDKRSLFREFAIPSPYISTKDIFALRDSRVVNAYRKISLKKMELAVPNVPLRQRVDLRIIPDIKTGISEIRFWHNRKLAGTASARNEDLNIQNF